ncbi:NO-inducible flavohemoprotein [Hydrogenovibrio kuenenii]|uniref:NO-inducible flavohemoprotein n=1 Tax=Hydrogenovibrio kuenenii TaxID=63658 RepID=UPI0004654DE8|nr:NO-inducible flavohemoprotein [Hydrogenovibrio kuenenii]
MLSDQIIQTIKETAPVLAEQGVQITDIFYTKLFANHPELKNIFNMANQAQGEQSKALAESVFMYASYIDQLDYLTPMVKRIAHKHASLHILPEHYPIVGKYLLESIKEYLGLGDNDPILEAWAVAYDALACIFIDVEEQIYAENENKLGGWRGFKPFLIDQIVEEAEGVKSFYLLPEDKELVSFKAGQYVGVKTKPANDGYDEIRQYSLSNAPGDDFYRITVKAENMSSNPGVVSNYLHSADVGDAVWLQPPTGDFVLKESFRSKVFIAGGVGITPVLSMLLNELRYFDSEQITFIQCCRDKKHHIMEKELRTLQENYGFKYYVAYESDESGDHQGYLTKHILSEWLPENEADVYFCGPKSFMSEVNKLCMALGYEEDQLHYEVFGPTTKLS